MGRPELARVSLFPLRAAVRGHEGVRGKLRTCALLPLGMALLVGHGCGGSTAKSSDKDISSFAFQASNNSGLAGPSPKSGGEGGNSDGWKRDPPPAGRKSKLRIASDNAHPVNRTAGKPPRQTGSQMPRRPAELAEFVRRRSRGGGTGRD